MAETTTLYRPAGQAELDLIAASGYRAFPPRLPEQPIFYPVLNEAYATQIARDWNASHNRPPVGYVTRFEIRTEYLRTYEVHVVGRSQHSEYWIPAEELDEFNRNLVGLIDVIAEYPRAAATVSSDYFIGVNAAEIDRLRGQHEAWQPETESLWNDAGFRSFGSILDLGCGPGFTSLDLAQEFVSFGEVCAVDKASAYLEYLVAESGARELKNITVLNTDVTKSGPIRGDFDGAFCRWFLAFLRDDLDVVLQNIRESLRPGGVFAAMEYLTLRTAACSPSSAAFDAHTRAWIEFYARHGGNSSIGESLPQRLAASGFKIRSLKCVGGMAYANHRWWEWWGRLIQDFGPKFVETGLLRTEEWDTLRRDWAAFSGQPHSFIHTPILLQIIAERA